MICPNLSDPKIKEQFTKLENLHPNLAYYLWDKYEGEVPAKYYNIPSTGLFQEPIFQTSSNQPTEAIIASEKTIRDLAARMSDRIGIPVRFESDRTKQYKGKLDYDAAVINLAYATLDTPIHEILGHPIIRAIKGNGQLYQNLLKELEYGKGKEVLDRIKRDYVYKEEGYETYTVTAQDHKNGKFLEAEIGEKFSLAKRYTLEEQQEEAIVELLGLYTAEKLDKVKDGKLISLLKRLLKEIKAFMKDLLGQREVEIDKLPDNMTIGDLSDLLAYSNSKLILPGMEVIYTTPDNQQFKTYGEASKHISDLAKSVEDVDLSNIKVQKEKVDSVDEILIDRFEIRYVGRFPSYYVKIDGKWHEKEEYTPEYSGDPGIAYYPISDDKILSLFNSPEQIGVSKSGVNILGFIQRNKEYEQSKEIIEEYKKVNNIQYNPEEVYSRGQGFYSAFGAYSDLDVDLMMQNLLQHIEDNEKAGGKFAISAFTKPVDKTIRRIEKSGLNYIIYPKSEDILWAANTDVHSGSVWDASEKINKDKKSELLGVSYTKYPSLINVDNIQPNLASIIDNLAHHHNELGIQLTGNNFRLEINKEVIDETDGKEYYKIKAWVDKINSILDQKYGKLNKPKIETIRNFIGLSVNYKGDDTFKTVNSYDSDIFKLYDISNGKETIKGLKSNEFDFIDRPTMGIQPTQTKKTLKESIESVKDKIIVQDVIFGNPFKVYNREFRFEYFVNENRFELNELERLVEGGQPRRTNRISVEESKNLGITQDFINNQKKELKNKVNKEKEYTSQAIINTKITKLKEVAKKYPRSLIRSEVKPIVTPSITSYTVIEFDDLPFQRIPSAMYSKETEKQIISKYVQQEKVKDLILDLINNPEYINLEPAKKSKYIQKAIFNKEIRPLESRKSVTIVDGYRVILKPTEKTFRGATKQEQYKNFKGYAYSLANNLNKTYAFTYEPVIAKLESLNNGSYELVLQVQNRYYDNLIKIIDAIEIEALDAEVEAMQALELFANIHDEYLQLMKESNTMIVDGEALPFDGQWFDSRFHTALAVNNPEFEKFGKVISFLSTKFKGSTWSYNPYLDQIAKINLSTGEIMFNPNLMSSETPWHEFGHILVRSIRQNNPELFKELKKEIEDLHKDNPISSSYAIVKALYPEYGLSDSFWEEVITTELGKQADVEYRNRDSKTIWQKIYDYFKELFSFEVNEKTNMGNLVDSLLSKEEVDLIEKQYNPELVDYMFSRHTSEDRGRMLKEAIELLPTNEQQTFGEKIKTLAEKITDKDLNAIRFSTQKLRLQGESKLLQESANSLDRIKDLVTKEDIAEAYYELANYISTSNVHLRNVAQRIRENKQNEELAPQIKLSALYFANQQAEAFERQINELRNMFSESAQKAIDSINTEQRQLRNNNIVFYNIKVIEDTIGIIKREVDREALVPLSEELYSAIEKGMDDLRFELNEQIEKVKKEKISDLSKKQKIKEIEKRLAELPKGPEDIKKLLSDPNSKNNWFRQSFDSAFLTDTPTVRIVADYILKGMQGVMPELQKMNNRIQEIQERINKDNKEVFGAIIDRKKMYKNYVREVEYFYVEENELKSITVYALNTQTDTVALQNEITKLKFELSKATEESKKLELTKKINDFYKNYTERPFTDEYYEVSESLPEDIAIARNQIYSKINSLREQIGIGNFDGNSLNDVLLIQDIKDLQSELDNMERLYDIKGNKKTGKALQDAEAIIKWKLDKRAKELVSYELTEASRQAFDIEFKKQFDAYQFNLSKATTEEERKAAQEAFDAWSSINVRTTYKQEFYDKRQSVLDAISYYLGDRGNLTKKYEELFNVLKGQKDTSGVYMPSNYSKEIIDRSKKIEEEIEEIKQLVKKDSKLDSETKAKLAPLFKMLDDLQSTAVSSYYTETKETIQNELRSEIVAQNPTISEEELNRQVHQKYVTSQWYKDNHIIKNRWDDDSQTMVQVFEPIFVWRVTRPNNPDYVEKNQPGFTWYRSVVNPKFKNENYKQGQVQFKEVTSGPYYNKNYDSLTDNQKSIVNDLRAIHLENQKGLYAKDRLGDVIPGQLKTGNDRFVDTIKFRANSFSSLWTNVKTRWQGRNQQNANIEEGYGEQESDFLQKEHGTDNLSKSRKIFMRFAKPLDVSKQSYDILGAIANYGGSSHQFRALRKMQAVVLSASEKTTAEVDKVQINNMIESLFYGQSIKGKGKLAKSFNAISRMATAAAGRKSLGYNLLAIPQNLVTGLKQNLINIVSHGITLNSLRKGTVDATMASKDFFLYHGQLGKKPMSLQLLDYFGVEQKESFFQGLNVTNTGFRKYGSVWSIVNTIREYTEFEIAAQVGFAYMNQYRVKLKDSDQTIPLKDAFELKDGTLQVRPDIETGKDFDNIVQYVRNKIYVATRRSQGIYDSMSQPELNRYTLGKLMLFLKKWVLNDVKSIYGRSTIHYGAGFETEGSWSAFAQLISDAYAYNGNIFAAYRTSSQAVKGGVVKGTLNAVVWYALVNTLIGLQKATDCEEDGEADWADYACYFMKRIINEVEGAFTLWGMNETVYTYYIEQSNGVSFPDKLFGALSGPVGILGRYFSDFDKFASLDPYYRRTQSKKVDWDKTHPFLAGKPALAVGAIEYLGLRGLAIDPKSMEFNNRRINDYMPKTYSSNLLTRFKKDHELEKMSSRLPLQKLERQFKKQYNELKSKLEEYKDLNKDPEKIIKKINNLRANYSTQYNRIRNLGNVWEEQQLPFAPKVSIMGNISDKKIEKINEDDLDK
jgi:hypothetical protein